MLHGTEFKNPEYLEKFKYKTKFRIVPLNFGEYDNQKIIDYSYNIALITLLSLSFFIVFPYLLKKNFSFMISMGIALIIMFFLFTVSIALFKKLGIDVL